MVPKCVDMHNNNNSVELEVCTSQRDRCMHENEAILVWHGVKMQGVNVTLISGEWGHDDADRHLLPGEQSARTGGNQLQCLWLGKEWLVCGTWIDSNFLWGMNRWSVFVGHERMLIWRCRKWKGWSVLWDRNGWSVLWDRNGCSVLWDRNDWSVLWDMNGCSVLWDRNGWSVLWGRNQ